MDGLDDTAAGRGSGNLTIGLAAADGLTEPHPIADLDLERWQALDANAVVADVGHAADDRAGIDLGTRSARERDIQAFLEPKTPWATVV
jgi:hypothetical protein